jgi:hypothetical protein
VGVEPDDAWPLGRRPGEGDAAVQTGRDVVGVALELVGERESALCVEQLVAAVDECARPTTPRRSPRTTSRVRATAGCGWCSAGTVRAADRRAGRRPPGSARRRGGARRAAAARPLPLDDDPGRRRTSPARRRRRAGRARARRCRSRDRGWRWSPGRGRAPARSRVGTSGLQGWVARERDTARGEPPQPPRRAGRPAPAPGEQLAGGHVVESSPKRPGCRDTSVARV